MKKLLLSACICLMGLSVQAMEDIRRRPAATSDSWDLPYGYNTGGPTTTGGLSYVWRTELNDQKARGFAWEYFFESSRAELSGITPQDIHVAMKRFPGFLTWKVGNERTPVHAVILNQIYGLGANPETLRYLLGFSPNLNVRDASGKTPEEYAANSSSCLEMLNQYKQRPWRHPENVFEFTEVPHNEYIYDGVPFVRNDGLVAKGHEFDPQLDEFVEVRFRQPSFFRKIFDRKVLGVLGTMVLLGLLYKYTAGNKGKKRNRLRHNNR